MDYKYISHSVDDTLMLAENVESEKFPNMVICLEGDLGCGKTVFVKGFANALGIDEVITSPTFTIIKEYLNGELPLYHMDVYRLEDNNDEIGIEDYYHKGGITIIEWADLIPKRLPKEYLLIKFKISGENVRSLIFEPHGEKYEELCAAVL